MSFAIIFPGQGSQAVGMLSTLADEWPQVEETFSEASDALSYDLWQLVQQGPDSDLNQTDKTQPAMLAAGVACWRVWTAATAARPSHLAGHSLGEYTALVAATALDFSAAVKLVEKRGQLMQAAVPQGQGAMAAILGLTDEQVITVCELAAQGDVVQAVNFNSPGQVVIAGTTSAVERAVNEAKAAGAKRALILPVSVPSHCALMKGAADELALCLADTEFKTPQIQVIHNVDVASHPSTDDIRMVLTQQLFSPVRWVETVHKLAEAGVTGMVEAGPGKVLTGLGKRINRDLQVQPLLDPVSLVAALETYSK